MANGHFAVGFGESQWSDQPNDQAFYAPDFFLENSRPWLNFEHIEIWSEKAWASRFFKRHPSKLFFEFEEPDQQEFEQRFEKIRSLKNLKKAVPVVFAKSTLESPFNPLSCLSNLSIRRFSSPDPRPVDQFPYGFWSNDEAMIGITPEILFSYSDKILHTMAVAGTAPLDAGSLLDDPKEMHEHQLVVEDIGAQLSGFGVVEIGQTAEKTLPSLRHLITPIQVKLNKPYSVEELTQALHPTAALGGYPRKAARTWLLEQPEAYFRRRFGAPFGFVEKGRAHVVVAIRNVQYHDNCLWLGSGCGIVEQSQSDKEWRELCLKRNSVKAALGIL